MTAQHDVCLFESVELSLSEITVTTPDSDGMSYMLYMTLKAISTGLYTVHQVDVISFTELQSALMGT